MANILQSLQLWTVVVFILIAIGYLCFIYNRKSISPFEYFIHGIALIIVSTVMVAVLTLLNATTKFTADEKSYYLLTLQYQIALYFLPLVTAAIGGNLISQAITQKHS